MNLTRLPISEASNYIKDLRITPLELVESHFNLITELEPYLQAWVTVDFEGARKMASELTKEAERGEIRGPLHGIPVGIKDIYNTKGMATTMGTPRYKDNIPTEDSEIVSTLRKAGAIILGKTETTEFACLDPAPTRNPWNLKHTPGGSSSGSAAAVSSGMCPLAFGSQTGGSVTRPASFCGVVGIKPTYDLLSRRGIFPLAWSLDHVGFMTKTVGDSALTLNVLTGKKIQNRTIKKPRISFLEGYFKENASDDVRDNFLKVLKRLASAGAVTEELKPPKGIETVHSAHRVIMAAEAAAVHESAFKEDPNRYRPNIRGLICSGLMVSSTTYLRAQRIRRIFIENTQRLMSNYDVIATPSAPTPAPLDLQSTGSASFNSPWSLSGFPTLTIPSGLNKDNLPLGLQLTAEPYREELLIDVGLWCEKVLGSIGDPPSSYSLN